MVVGGGGGGDALLVAPRVRGVVQMRMTCVAAAAGDGLLLGDAGLPDGCDEARLGVSAAAAAAAAAAAVHSLIALSDAWAAAATEGRRRLSWTCCSR